ncbi:asparaginase [Fulvivirga lutea]|uniref:asparaginase n=1 Tax=Fulvivirga lutea TaxID=2810512 RepID=A0A974WHE3_9BACT|nr:asparaginase [Fulvivirga lutea]QSE97172.1 asparaginase [Fulvivirga lutea]
MKITKSNIITSAARPPESTILIIYTGGTLGMIHNEGGALIPFDFSSIMDHIPSLRQLELNITVMSFEEPIDSSNVNPSHWELIGKLIFENYNEFDGFVVLHGTDTMAYTASALSFMLENLTKPVVFTGAQLPISSPRSDARENLITSIVVASSRENGKPIVPEVCIYFDAVLLRGNRSKKVESIHFDAFESENYPLLAEAGVEISYNHKFIHQVDHNKLKFHQSFDTNVAVLKLFPGVSKQSIEAFFSIPQLRGVVIETYGSGNAPTYDWFLEIIKKSIDKGVVVFNVSQCPGGKVDQGRYETSEDLEAIGVIGGADITLEAAISKLMLVLSEEEEIPQIRHRMLNSMCGEMTIN